VKRLSPVIRISTGLVLLTSSLLLMLDVFGLTPLPRDTALEARVQLCEALAAQAAAAAERNDLASIRAALHVVTRRNPEVLSGGLRDARGRLLIATPEHRSLWSLVPGERSPTSHVQVPLFKRGERWADIELRFEELHSAGFLQALWQRPVVRLVALLAGTGFIAYAVYMRRMLQYLDPSAVIPTRVQAALDVMTEGVVLLDPGGRIVLANAAFAGLVGRSEAELLGADPSKLQWRQPEGAGEPDAPPWICALREGKPAAGVSLQLSGESDGVRSFVVKAAPVLDARGRAKGAIVTFDDVTELEHKSAALETALVELEKHQAEIRLQNEELQVLAQRDPLTGVANRRHFLENLEEEFVTALRAGDEVCCVMADIDHFKKINDSHGHLAGDEVIRRVADVLKSEVRNSDAICRFGGEEFCIVLRNLSIDKATLIADRLRLRVAAPAFARVPVTVSFGVTSSVFGAHNWQELVKQADDALYASKASGRNRVTRWDRMEPGSS
jgi:diguanylate cyclase (GGDEF)-like protein